MVFPSHDRCVDPDKSKGMQAEMPHARTVITFGIIPMEGQESMLVCEEYVVVKAILTDV